MFILKKTIFFLLCIGYAFTLNAQAFKKEIQSFKKQDSINPPPKNAILFIGSSSFTKWKDVQDYFPGYTILNRGFGGSTIPDIIRYEDAIVFPYNPKQIVIYCGENDIASSDSISGKIVFERFRQLFKDLRNQFPKCPLIYISMKPSLARWEMRERLIEGNKRIEKYLKRKKHTKFISVWADMLGADGKPINDIFIEDGLHMNTKGYAIWTKLIQPYLVP